MTLLLIIPVLVLGRGTEPSVGDLRQLAAARDAHVFVIDADRREWEGKLLEVAQSALAVELADEVRRIQLSDVRRVDRRGDSIKDGTFKGALVGLLLSLTLARGVDARAVGTYAFLGMCLDALHSHKNTIYKGR